MKKRILILNHDAESAKEIKYSLQNESTETYYADSVQDALIHLKRYPTQLVIMDINLAEADGFKLLETMRTLKTVPILVLSSAGDHTQHIQAMKSGADIVLSKESISLEYLLAQAEALMRRHAMPPDEMCRNYTLVFGKDLIIEPEFRRVTLQGQPLDLTRKEFDMLLYLASQAGRVLGRNQIYDNVWSDESNYDIDASVRNRISELRRKLNMEGKSYIETVWGVGYRFNPDPEETFPVETCEI